MDVVFRITHGGGNIDIYDREMSYVRKQNVQTTDRFWLQSNYVLQYFLEDKYSIVLLTLKLETIDLRDKLDTLYGRLDAYNQPEVLTVYYRYKLAPADNISAQFDRNSFKEDYYKSAKLIEEVTLKFVETN